MTCTAFQQIGHFQQHLASQGRQCSIKLIKFNNERAVNIPSLEWFVHNLDMSWNSCFPIPNRHNNKHMLFQQHNTSFAVGIHGTHTNPATVSHNFSILLAMFTIGKFS